MEFQGEVTMPINRVEIVVLCMNLLLLMPVSAFSQNSGNISYTLQRASNPTQDQQSAYNAITKAMDAAIGYYNQLTTITKQLTVQYNPGTPTADASFNGNIRFGSNRSYMVVLTAMHEIAHTVGVGTTTEYRNLIQNKRFTGTHTTAVIREILGNPDTLLSGDDQHFWPYGLNYASEVKSEQDLINHCKIVNAIVKDLFGAEEFYRTCRIRSHSDDRCMVAVDGSDLSLGNCDDEAAIVDLIALGEQTYRLEFGDQVLDIPNESRNAGVAASLYGWNGGAHQREVFEAEDGTDDGPFRIRMLHSGLYLQADGNRIVQNSGNGSDDSFIWEMVDERVASDFNNHTIRMSENRIHITSGRIVFTPDNDRHAEILITDVRGRNMIRRSIDGACEIPIGQFAKGMYIVSMKSGNMMVVRRIIRQ